MSVSHSSLTNNGTVSNFKLTRIYSWLQYCYKINTPLTYFFRTDLIKTDLLLTVSNKIIPYKWCTNSIFGNKNFKKELQKQILNLYFHKKITNEKSNFPGSNQIINSIQMLITSNRA